VFTNKPTKHNYILHSSQRNQGKDLERILEGYEEPGNDEDIAKYLGKIDDDFILTHYFCLGFKFHRVYC